MALGVPQLPVNLVLAGRPCLVVGGGAVAARKAEALLRCEAQVHVVASRVGAEVRALISMVAGQGGLTWEERPWRAGELSLGTAGPARRRYWLVMVAVDDPALSRAVAEEAGSAGMWVNVADDAGACSLTLPSVLRRGEVTVAVATGGQSPALATWLRDRLAAEVGPEYSVLAGLLSEAREGLRAGGRHTEGLDWQTVLDSDMLALVRAGRLEEARERLKACLSLS
jgi:siroheme synthase-like protein